MSEYNVGDVVYAEYKGHWIKVIIASMSYYSTTDHIEYHVVESESGFSFTATKVKPFMTVLKPSEASEYPTGTQVSPYLNKPAVEPSDGLPEPSNAVISGTKNDSGKLRFDLVPVDSLQEIVEVITYGENKYPAVEVNGVKIQNWRLLPDAKNRLFAAAQRHLWLHRSGEVKDKETNLKHLAHAASSLMFLIALENSDSTD